ncbi:unnamed protein product [Vicia faba]|uniref:Uncharacterized protein n=1 Tax=Vicia faba TaxID=3906 RepID=A0AAV1ABS9_VICFA|nr:unnamed protein product [Vicia faba]
MEPPAISDTDFVRHHHSSAPPSQPIHFYLRHLQQLVSITSHEAIKVRGLPAGVAPTTFQQRRYSKKIREIEDDEVLCDDDARSVMKQRIWIIGDGVIRGRCRENGGG